MRLVPIPVILGGVKATVWVNPEMAYAVEPFDPGDCSYDSQSRLLFIDRVYTVDLSMDKLLDHLFPFQTG